MRPTPGVTLGVSVVARVRVFARTGLTTRGAALDLTLGIQAQARKGPCL